MDPLMHRLLSSTTTLPTSAAPSPAARAPASRPSNASPNALPAELRKHSVATAYVHRETLVHNVRQLRQRVGPAVTLCPAVKANAYGHGLAIVLQALRDSGEVTAVCVAQLDEALACRQLGWDGRVLLLGLDIAVGSSRQIREKLDLCVAHRIEPTITRADEIDLLHEVAVSRDVREPIGVQVKVDTGMHRFGLEPASAVWLARKVRSSRHLRLAGAYSHFACADETADHADAFTREQFAAFEHTINGIEDDGQGRVSRHIANSAAILRWSEYHLELVRPGGALYGLSSSTTLPVERFGFRPVMRVCSQIVMLKHLQIGDGVGYGQTVHVRRPTWAGVVPVGYHDGYRRSLSNRGSVRVSGVDCPILGRVNMDSIVIDVTDAPSVAVGHIVELIGTKPGRANSVSAIAELAETIPYDVTSGLGERIGRVGV